MSLLSSSRERDRFFRFLAVGTIGALVDFLVMNFFSHVFHMKLVLAGSISFVCAVVSNFLLNRIWTYPDSRSRPVLGQLLMFALVNLAGVLIRIPILYFLEPPLQRFLIFIPFKLPISTEFLARNGTLAVAITVVMLWNFFVNRYWTYNDVSS